MDWKDQVTKHLKTQSKTLQEQNIIIIKMDDRVNLMWKAFVGGIGLILITLLVAILALVVRG